MRFSVVILIVTLSIGGISTPAGAQALSPMSSEFVSFSDRFLVQLTAFNPYERQMPQTIRVFDQEWQIVEDAFVSRPQFLLGPRQKTSFVVMVPFGGVEQRIVYVCNISPAFKGAGRTVRGEVCGKYTAYRQSY